MSDSLDRVRKLLGFWPVVALPLGIFFVGLLYIQGERARIDNAAMASEISALRAEVTKMEKQISGASAVFRSRANEKRDLSRSQPGADATPRRASPKAQRARAARAKGAQGGAASNRGPRNLQELRSSMADADLSELNQETPELIAEENAISEQKKIDE